MYKLIFKDDDKNIMSSLSATYEELHAIKKNICDFSVSNSNYAIDIYRCFLTGENERIHFLTGEILRDIKDEGGIFTISLSCPLYIANRIVEHSAMTLDVFKVNKIAREMWELSPRDRNILNLLQCEISICNYILKYAKQIGKSEKKRINSICSYTDTDLIGGVFDDYPNIGGFVPYPEIPCDGEDIEKSSK